jgi:tRNA uridine 5-carboxymethylaminomethyl modification enzyme
VKKQEHRALPTDVDYASIATLSKEAREKLNSIQPLSLGQAGRIPGVSPADVTALLLWLELRKRQSSSSLARAGTVNSTT